MPYLAWAGRIFSNMKCFYKEMNPATLTGAIDVIIIKQEDGTYRTSPWHIRFGKMGVFWTNQNTVDIEINGKPVNLTMKLGEAGEAFFLQEISEMSELEGNMASATLDITASSSNNNNNSNPLQKQNSLTHKDTDDIDTNNLYIKSTLTKARSSDDILFDIELEDKGANKTPRSKLTNQAALFVMNNNPLGMTTPTMTTTNPEFPTDVEMGENTPMNLSLLRCNSWPDICTPLVETDVQHDEAVAMEQNVEDPKCIVGSLPNDYFTPTLASSNGLPTPSSSTKPLQLLNSVNDKNIIIDDVDWKWGQLPETGSLQQQYQQQQQVQQQQQQQAALKNDASDSSKASKAINSSSSSSSKSKFKDQSQDGIYLDDLNAEDPELINLYLYNNSKTLYQHEQSPHHLTTNISASETTPGFPNHQSPFSLPESPVSFDKEEVVKVRVRAKSCSANNEEEFLNSTRLTPLPTLAPPPSHTSPPSPPMSQQSFGDIKMSLCGMLDDAAEGVMLEKFEKSAVNHEMLSSNPNLLNDPLLVVKLNGKYYKWAVAAPLIMSILVFNQPLADSARDQLLKTYMSKKEHHRRGWLGGWWGGTKEKSPNSTQESSPPPQALPPAASDVLSGLVKGDVMDGVDVVLNVDEAVRRTNEENMQTATSVDNIAINSSMEDNDDASKYFKSLKITSEQIEKLNLKEGLNEAVFSVTTKYQGTTRCVCCIFLWNWYDKIVISDIDGTITKSDVLGQVLPIISNLWPTVASDWSQVGIANLYTLIHQNGYRFMYLSARAIGQSRYTRDYLRGVRQGDYKLPIGPLLLSPSSLRSAFHKEVIERKPEEFKINCLRNIKELFPPTITNPFTAGFGNRINDVWAYATIGVPKSRIFIVDHTGQLRIDRSTFTSSYSKLSDIVDHMFPSVAVDTEYSTFNYWRDPSLTFGKSFNEEEAEEFLVVSSKNGKKRKSKRVVAS